MTRPDKPSPDFPLYAHASGKWAKRIEGKVHYFGSWDDPQAALTQYQRFTDVKRSDMVSQATSLENACNRFLWAKEQAMNRGELSLVSFNDYRRTCVWLVAYFGRSTPVTSLGPSNFTAYKAKLAERRKSVYALANEIVRCRVMFKWCFDERIISEPVLFGQDFRRPSQKVLRKHRRLQGKKLLTAEEIHYILDESGLQLRAMVLLGINCAFGPHDCATLPIPAVDLKDSMLSYPRPKTEIDRDIPLWPETVAALTAVLNRRRAPKPEAANRVFIRPDGRSWEGTDNLVHKRFQAAVLAAGLRHPSFYWLRHTFRTVADETEKHATIGAIMGHTDNSMAAVYREEVSKERLLAVVNHVRAWLFTVSTSKSGPSG